MALLTRYADVPTLRGALGMAMFRLGQTEAAYFHTKQALQLGKDDEYTVAAACDLLPRLRRIDEAIDQLELSIKQHPEWLIARHTLGGLYLVSDRLIEAQEQFEYILLRDATNRTVRLSLAACLGARGQSDRAIAMYRKLCFDPPIDQGMLEAFAFFLNGAAIASAQEVFQTHVRLGTLFAENASQIKHPFPVHDDPQRELLVAFVTHDFNQHSVSYFLAPLLKHLSRPGIKVAVYFTSPHTDEVTTRLSKLVDFYRHVPAITSQQLAERMVQEKVDIAIDLNGWTTGHRLHAFQIRCAPVQITYLGYANTTAIPNMDVRLVDAITDTPEMQSLATEKLVRLEPCFVCYEPPSAASINLPVGWRPPRKLPLHQLAPADQSSSPDALASRPIVFGSMNNMTKLSTPVLEAWSAILNRVPGSMLRIKGRGLKQAGSQAVLKERLLAAKIDPDRVTLQPQTESVQTHLEQYQHIDIALDTFPYNGTTTTCEALFTSTPVITTTGDRHASRVSASLLSAAGLGELVASSVDEYIDHAVNLASDRPRLAAYHASIHERLLASPLCDAARFADMFARTLRDIWKLRCEHGVGQIRSTAGN
jgi:predicted O-linked N-acetylglucosamine transferase (SPINDLY family)